MALNWSKNEQNTAKFIKPSIIRKYWTLYLLFCPNLVGTLHIPHLNSILVWFEYHSPRHSSKLVKNMLKMKNLGGQYTGNNPKMIFLSQTAP